MMDPVKTDVGESDMINVADIKNDDEIRPTETEQDDEIDIVVEDDGEQDDMIDVAMESVEVIVAEENNVMIDSDKEKSIEDIAAEATR